LRIFSPFSPNKSDEQQFFLVVAAGSNSAHAGPSNAVKLDNETEELKHDRLDLSVGKVIQQARTAKGLTQIELARVSFFFLSVK
jgi:hypothetical protein